MTTYQDVVDYLNNHYYGDYELNNNEPEGCAHTIEDGAGDEINIYEKCYNSSLTMYSELSRLLADLLDTPVDKRIKPEVKQVMKEGVCTTSTDTREGGFGSTDGGNHSKVVQELLEAHKEGQKVKLHGVLSQEDIRDLEGLGYLVSHDYDLDKDMYNNFWLVKSDTSSTNYRVNVARLLNAHALGEGCADYELTGISSVRHHLPVADVQQLHELGYKVIYQDGLSYTMIYLATPYRKGDALR